MTALTTTRAILNPLTKPNRSSTAVPPIWVAISLALFVVIWHVASLITGPAIVPGPIAVVQTIVLLTVDPLAGLTLPGHVLSSLTRWGSGFLFAVLIGVPVGIAFGAIRWVREAFAPMFEFLRYIPPFAWIPLAILWMGSGQTSASFIVFVAAFPAVVISTQVGIVNVDPRLPRAGINLGAGRVRLITQVLSPVALPSVFTGIRVAVSNGWMAVVAAEMIGGTQGVGFLIIQGQENGDVQVVMAGMIAIGITGSLIDWIVNVISRRATPWRKSNDEQQ
ncbi:ABC transporter permease [Microbacterium sp. A82]|uniref:ABC transporter permease n=1 Tax=Microbacterium sp. A82 TaxID=3450452 RepID=UPI003F31AAD5